MVFWNEEHKGSTKKFSMWELKSLLRFLKGNRNLQKGGIMKESVRDFELAINMPPTAHRKKSTMSLSPKVSSSVA